VLTLFLFSFPTDGPFQKSGLQSSLFFCEKYRFSRPSPPPPSFPPQVVLLLSLTFFSFFFFFARSARISPVLFFPSLIGLLQGALCLDCTPSKRERGFLGPSASFVVIKVGSGFLFPFEELMSSPLPASNAGFFGSILFPCWNWAQRVGLAIFLFFQAYITSCAETVFFFFFSLVSGVMLPLALSLFRSSIPI